MSISRLHAFLLVVLSALPAARAASNPKAFAMDEEDLKQLVVMIGGTIEGEPFIGAGIIFGAGSDCLYIVTANHVVRHGETDAERIELRLRWQPERTVRAHLLRQRQALDGQDLDIAVLRVDSLAGINARIDALPFDRLGDPSSLERGAGLFLIGYPLGKPWRVNVTPEKLAETGDTLEFESTFVAPGHSGGALLDADHDIVGMLRSDTPPYGQATSITAIIQRLKAWGLPVDLGRSAIPRRFVSLHAGANRVCGLTDTGASYCWGDLSTEDTGTLFSPIAVRVRGGLRFSSISVADGHACGLTTRGAAYCWGDNKFGRLGDGSFAASSIPVPVVGNLVFSSISSGNSETCAISVDGAAYCWGYAEGNEPKEVQGKLSFQSIVAGTFWKFGISTNRKTYSWQYDFTPTPGDVAFASISGSCGLTMEGAVYCWGPAEDAKNGGNLPIPIPGGRRFRFLSSHSNSVFGIGADGELYHWVLPDDYLKNVGNLANSTSLTPRLIVSAVKFKSIATGSDYTCGIAVDGDSYCWGRLSNTRLGGKDENYGATPIRAPRNPEADALRSIRVRLREGDYSGAFEQVDVILKKFPNSTEVRRLHALVLADLGKVAPSVAELKVLPGADNDRGTYLDLATVYARAGRFPEMKVAFQSARNLSSSETQRHEVEFALANRLAFSPTHLGAEEETRLRNEAEVGLRKILQSDPNSVDAMNDLGYLLAIRNDKLPEAHTLIGRALELKPREPDFMDSMALALYRMNRIEEAETFAMHAWQSCAQDPDISEHLANIYAKQAKYPDAERLFMEALQEWQSKAPIDIDNSAVNRLNEELKDTKRLETLAHAPRSAVKP